MTPPLFLVDVVPDGDTVELTGDEGRHAARVRRLGPGEQVTIGDGRGVLLDCTVDTVHPDGLLLGVHRRRTVSPGAPRLVVVQALAKGERAELAVETMTELGVDEIVPWAASRSVPRWDGSRGAKALERWQRTAREATKQSRRAWLPVIAPLAGTGDVVARLAHGTGLVLHESAAYPLATAALPSAGQLVLVVGPEGGISDSELDRFDGAGARQVRLGSSVLRTSTAGAAALAALAVRLGRWT
jgi:16S rRNA (uracil1498-N3)-methyltransferase